jgi:methyl-accepting chemotaxis protein
VAGSLRHFKDSLVAKKAADEAATVEGEARLRRSQRMDQIARDFEAMIGDVINTVSAASSELEVPAGTLTNTADQSEKVTATVAAASAQASTNLQTVAAAAEEMASSVDEISRQVQDSARIAGEAAQQAGRTNDHVGELARAAGGSQIAVRREQPPQARGRKIHGCDPRSIEVCVQNSACKRPEKIETGPRSAL